MTAGTAARPSTGGTRRSHRRRWPFVLAGTFLALVLAAAGYLLWFTPVLGVRSVVITGASGGLVDEIRGALSIADGTPLIRIDTGAAAQRVEQVPQVAQADVTRVWPNTVDVVVQPRTPVAVTSANGRLWLLDSTGKPYQQVAKPPPGLVTVLLATPGSDDPATRAALVVVDSMTADFRTEVDSVRADSPYQITVSLSDGRAVIWGGSDDGARKMQILPGLLTQPGRLFDISDPSMVTVR